jgi:quinol monooxygenase YgiN
VLAITRFRVPQDETEVFLSEVGEAVDALSRRPGFVRADVGRAAEDPVSWVLSTEWAGVGAYRRALSSYDVKVRASACFHRAEQAPGVFEVVRSVDGGKVARR